jgi:hypothetical protein
VRSDEIVLFISNAHNFSAPDFVSPIISLISPEPSLLFKIKAKRNAFSLRELKHQTLLYNQRKPVQL